MSEWRRRIDRSHTRQGYVILLAIGWTLFWSIFTSLYLGHDALTYLAAGERLNAGHALYALGPSDRPVDLSPPYFDAPLLSPPLIAVAFRPLAALPWSIGMWSWVTITAAAVFYTVWSLARDLKGLLLVLILGVGLGWATISGNMSDLFLLGYVALWRFRDDPRTGAIVGIMGIAKVIPFVLVGYLIARRDRKPLLWCGAGAVAALAISLVGAGVDAHIAYIGVLERSLPQPGSLPYLLGIRWLSPVLLSIGTMVAAVAPVGWSYAICLMTIVFGAPVLTSRELVALLPLLALGAKGSDSQSVK